MLFPSFDRSQFELTESSLKCIGAVSLQPTTEVEFVILISCKEEMNRLAGRRWTIEETFVEKNTGYWRPSRRDTRIEHWSLQIAQDRDRRRPLRSITIQVLSHGM
jgi:hypothetical protein